MMRIIHLAAVLISLAANIANAQKTQTEAICNLSLDETKSFLAFDQELRSAITNQDAAAMTLLVRYPLRVNDNGSSYSINNPAALQSHFQELFPKSTVKAVLDQKPAEVFCIHEGILYGNGVIRVVQTKLGFEIEYVHLPESRYQNALHKAAKLEFVCRTENHRIMIDSESANILRYRAWNNPRSVTDHPDIEIAKGNMEIEGTDGCSHAVWTFKNDATTYTVEEVGCFPDSNQPPEGSRGMVIVKETNKSELSEWCY